MTASHSSIGTLTVRGFFDFDFLATLVVPVSFSIVSFLCGFRPVPDSVSVGLSVDDWSMFSGLLPFFYLHFFPFTGVDSDSELNSLSLLLSSLSPCGNVFWIFDISLQFHCHPRKTFSFSCVYV